VDSDVWGKQKASLYPPKNPQRSPQGRKEEEREGRLKCGLTSQEKKKDAQRSLERRAGKVGDKKSRLKALGVKGPGHDRGI